MTRAELNSRPAPPRQAAKPEDDDSLPVSSGTLSPAAIPQAVAPEPTPVPTNGSGALIQSSGVYEAGRTKVPGGLNVANPLAARGSEESAAPFNPPAFLLKDSKPYVLRPHCLRPELCGGYGARHCGSCEAAASKRADREREVAA